MREECDPNHCFIAPPFLRNFTVIKIPRFSKKFVFSGRSKIPLCDLRKELCEKLTTGGRLTTRDRFTFLLRLLYRVQNGMCDGFTNERTHSCTSKPQTTPIILYPTLNNYNIIYILYIINKQHFYK